MTCRVKVVGIRMHTLGGRTRPRIPPAFASRNTHKWPRGHIKHGHWHTTQGITRTKHEENNHAPLQLRTINDRPTRQNQGKACRHVAPAAAPSIRPLRIAIAAGARPQRARRAPTGASGRGAAGTHLRSTVVVPSATPCSARTRFAWLARVNPRTRSAQQPPPLAGALHSAPYSPLDTLRHLHDCLSTCRSRSAPMLPAGRIRCQRQPLLKAGAADPA
jgi:hypothetical protein